MATRIFRNKKKKIVLYRVLHKEENKENSTNKRKNKIRGTSEPLRIADREKQKSKNT